ncbi:MAG: T9SS C-terminal target domain-containing protein [Bacteroidetes bacterium]|nr:MAG: T9SS C-terminal target domain-containing protein [Bacteroidota bacterium]
MDTHYPGRRQPALFERWLESHMALSRADTLLTIPVIVHVVHDGEAVGCGTNLRAEQVWSQIEVLNEDFRRLPGTPGFNDNPVGADVMISFCPAVVDPEGNLLPEPGIHRVDRREMGFANPPYGINYTKQTILPQTFWDPDRYMNIWTVALGDFLGFAQLPSQSTLPDLSPVQGPAETDGVVISPTAFGRTGTVQAPYNHGRTTTHEVGHWLGLRHIWGDGPCGTDDYCEDTPDASDPHYDCPEVPTETCGSVDMSENYMDYTDDQCMNLFTRCQRTRMRMVMQHAPRRASLLSSTVCQGPPRAIFSSDQQFACPGVPISFRDAPARAKQWNWRFPGGLPTQSTDSVPVVIYPTPGAYTVELIVANEWGADTLILPDLVQVDSVGLGPVYQANFSAGWAGWTISNPDTATTWERMAVGDCDTARMVAAMSLYDYTRSGARDALVSPPIDLSGYPGGRLHFTYAYRQGSPADRDSLIVTASVDGGITFPFRLWAAGGSDLATGEPVGEVFVPRTASDWCGSASGQEPCPAINLGSLAGSARLRLRFETINDFGNHLYLSDVRIDGACIRLWEPPSNPLTPFLYRISPNPNAGDFELYLFAEAEIPLEIRMYDLRGRQVWEEVVPALEKDQILPVKLPAGQRVPGLYVLELSSGDTFRYQRILIQPD